MPHQHVLRDATWVKSSYSPTQDECVEVALLPDITGVRDTKDRDGSTLVFNNTIWSGFLEQIKAGRYDAHS